MKPPRRGDAQERRDAAQNDKRILGHVVQCDGARATIAAFADSDEGTVTGLWTVGKHDLDQSRSARTVGLVYAIGKPTAPGTTRTRTPSRSASNWSAKCATARPAQSRSSTAASRIYPHIGAIAHRIRTRDLQAVYDLAGRHSVTIGTLSQDEIDRRQHRHRRHAEPPLRRRRHHRRRQVDRRLAAAAQGDRGAARPARPDPRSAQRIRRRAARIHACAIDTNTLDLPFWMFRLEEFAEVLFRGREIGAGRSRRCCATSSRWPRTSTATPARRRLSAPRRRCADRRHAGALPHGRSDQADRRAHGTARQPRTTGRSCSR